MDKINSIKDLKTGMLIKLRGGSCAMIMMDTKNGDIFCGETWGELNLYNGFKRDFDVEGNYDIVSVHQPKYNANYGRLGLIDECPIIWEEKMEIVLMGVTYKFTQSQAEEMKNRIETYKEECDAL